MGGGESMCPAKRSSTLDCCLAGMGKHSTYAKRNWCLKILGSIWFETFKKDFEQNYCDCMHTESSWHLLKSIGFWVTNLRFWAGYLLGSQVVFRLNKSLSKIFISLLLEKIPPLEGEKDGTPYQDHSPPWTSFFQNTDSTLKYPGISKPRVGRYNGLRLVSWCKITE